MGQLASFGPNLTSFSLKLPSYCNDPKDGLPSHFYDELRTDLSNEGTTVWHAGSRIRLAMVPQRQLMNPKVRATRSAQFIWANGLQDSYSQTVGSTRELWANLCEFQVPPLDCAAVPFEERHDCGFSGATSRGESVIKCRPPSERAQRYIRS
jgi:hypothetical protein